MMIVTLITAVAHLIQIALWALVYLLYGEMATFETAFYFSAQNYTALGYGDVVLSQRWRLLGPLEAINGLLLFGLRRSLEHDQSQVIPLRRGTAKVEDFADHGFEDRARTLSSVPQ
jgi:hypothetical protein